MDDPITHLINTYHELNPTAIDELDEEPSPLEFMRYVSSNRPFVVRRGAKEWNAAEKWDAGYLREAMQGVSVEVANTPCGNADAVVELRDGTLSFIEPHETLDAFSDFLDYVQQSTRSNAGDNTRIVKYAQTQNDNLREEYSNLFSDVPKDIAFARIALQKHADAVNMWIGNESSVTSLHKDNYENIYVQIRGQKRFVLLSPVEMPCVNEQLLPRARYAPESVSGSQVEGRLRIKTTADNGVVPVATWDPDTPERRPTSYSTLARPLPVTLSEGDMLYLPAMWYHKVSQTSGDEGFACAVNYWYDMEFGGSFWATNNFVREVMDQKVTSPVSLPR